MYHTEIKCCACFKDVNGEERLQKISLLISKWVAFKIHCVTFYKNQSQNENVHGHTVCCKCF